MQKPYRCGGSFKLGTACANIAANLPEGTNECARCKMKPYTVTERDAAVAIEAERTKDFPANRVKKN
jgi:hypothetical protein|tara:strand:+ start:15597 stop:15797 length:201 start_codon:yes stop_codon:yes gene_type:complete